MNRSRGHLIHLLHGDDIVNPGFYTEMGSLFEQFPSAGQTFCKHSIIDDQGHELRYSKDVMQQRGYLPDWLDQIATTNYCQPPSVVVKRSVYEDVGGYFGAHYGEDWEMWCRIASRYPVAYSPECLAGYRIHNDNITAKAYLSGQNIKDIETIINIIKVYIPTEKRKSVISKSKYNFSTLFAGIAAENFSKDRKKYFNLAYRAFLMDKNRRTLSCLTKITWNYILGTKSNT